MLKDIRERLKYGAEHNVTGFIARTDWEGVQDWSCFDNLNMLNLYAITAYAENPGVRENDIYLKWLTGEKMLEENITPQMLKKCIKWISNILNQTWDVVKNTNFVNGAVFSNDSCILLTTEQAAFIGGTHHSLKEWDPTKGDVLTVTKNNISQIVADKDFALDLCEKLYTEVIEGNCGLTEIAYKKLVEHFEFMRMYVRGFRLSARGYCFGRYASEVNPGDILVEGKTAGDLLKEVITDLEQYRKELSNCAFMQKYPCDALLNLERVTYFLSDLKALAKQAGV